MSRFKNPDHFAVDHRLSINRTKDGEISIWGNEAGLRHLIEEIELVLRGRDHRHLFSEDHAGWDLTPQKFGSDDEPADSVCITFHEHWDD